MTWAIPAAWALAAGVLLPLVAHLWSRRRPPRLAWPTVRFLRASSPVSRRLRTVQDWPLLMLRLAMVVVLAAAAAGPTVATRARTARWQARLHRVIVRADIPAGSQARARIDDEIARLQAGTSSSTVIQSGPWDARWREAARVAAIQSEQQRTEVVVFWDGSRQGVRPDDLATLPAGAGVSLRPIMPVLATAPTFDPAALEGGRFVIHAAEADAPVRTAVLASLRALVPAAPRHPVTIYWPGVAVPRPAMPAPPAVHAALAHLAEDVRVRDAATRSGRDTRGEARPSPAQARVIARGVDGTPLLQAWGDGERLVVVSDANPSSPLALWGAVAALDASASPDTWAASSPAGQWTAAEIASATRVPREVSGGRLPGGLDTRAVWGFLLLLVAVEQWWRSRGTQPSVADMTISSEDRAPDAA